MTEKNDDVESVSYVDRFGNASRVDPSTLSPEQRLQHANRVMPLKRRGLPPVTDNELMAAFDLSPKAFNKLSPEARLKLINRVQNAQK